MGKALDVLWGGGWIFTLSEFPEIEKEVRLRGTTVGHTRRPEEVDRSL